MDAVIKRLYLANGQLFKPLSIRDDDIAMTGNIPDLLGTLDIGDHCYLTIIEENKLEVVKIEKVASWYEVYRAQDGTERQAFSTSAKIVYRLTTQELRDAASSTPLNIYPDGYGALEVDRSGNIWSVKYTDLDIKTLGGISWMNPDYSQIVIIDNDGMFGCCDNSLTGAPYAGGQIFYLTSQLYSNLTIDGFVGINKSNKSDIPPINFGGNWWLLDQPSIKEKYVSGHITLMDWEVYGGMQSFNNIEQYVIGNVKTLDWEIYGGAKEFSSDDMYIKMDAYVLEMELFGGAIVYNGIDKYISQKIDLLDWTLQ